jgi:hypothetical protein
MAGGPGRILPRALARGESILVGEEERRLDLVDAGRQWPRLCQEQTFGTSSVGSLTGYHPPHATSRVLHVAMTTRDQVDVGVANGLTSSITTVHAECRGVSLGDQKRVQRRRC